MYIKTCTSASEEKIPQRRKKTIRDAPEPSDGNPPLPLLAMAAKAAKFCMFMALMSTVEIRERR